MVALWGALIRGEKSNNNNKSFLFLYNEEMRYADKNKKQKTNVQKNSACFRETTQNMCKGWRASLGDRQTANLLTNDERNEVTQRSAGLRLAQQVSK